MDITLDQFALAAGGRQENAKRWHPVIVQAMKDWGITSPIAIAGFIAQMSVECQNFTNFTESLNYSVQGLVNTWPARFAVDPRASAKYPNAQAWAMGRIDGKQACDQKALANLVYGGRFGNRPGTDDGSRFIGRGPKQITFHDNYFDCGVAIGLDLITNPDLLLVPEHGAQSAAWYWTSRHCTSLMEAGNYEGVTKAINGGLIGQDKRVAALARAKQALSLS